MTLEQVRVFDEFFAEGNVMVYDNDIFIDFCEDSRCFYSIFSGEEVEFKDVDIDDIDLYETFFNNIPDDIFELVKTLKKLSKDLEKFERRGNSFNLLREECNYITTQESLDDYNSIEYLEKYGESIVTFKKIKKEKYEIKENS